MTIIELINKKKQGEILTKEEINFIVQGYTRGEIPDYQISAFLMAVYFRGMNEEETTNFTYAMVNSGETIELYDIKGVKVDKHSSGGVGDKISLIVIPLVASLGIPIVKMSGKGLGHAGGTIDKLSAIEGFNLELSREEIIKNVNEYKMAILSQSSTIVPADKKLYELRDVTGTVDSIPLIASSIMSKKLALGSDAIVLDVKVGSGAFMKSIDEAIELAKLMVSIGKLSNRKTIAIVTNMDQPLGYEIGNANEIIEAIDVLKGKGPEDVREIALTIASHMAVLGGVFSDFSKAYTELEKIIRTGKAVNKFKELIEIQGGTPMVVDDINELPKARWHIEIKSTKEGYVNSIDANSIGYSAMLLGAGRSTKEDSIDFSAGLTIIKKVGDIVEIGDTLCILHTNLQDYVNAEKLAYDSFFISNVKPLPTKYIHHIIA